MRRIFALALTLAATGLSAQNSTISIHTTDGGITTTDINDVERITFEDSEYKLNSSGDRILEYDEVNWPDDRLIPYFLPPARIVYALDIHMAGLNDQEKLMFSALQGIVNRTRPRILLFNNSEEGLMTWPDAHDLRLSTASHLRPYRFVDRFKSEINGLVLYSTEKSAHYANLAVTIAGLDRLLPVTPEIRQKLIDEGMDFPVVEDLTTLTMTTPQSIYTHLYNNYWPRCNHRILVSLRPEVAFTHEIAVAVGSASVWLDPKKSGEKTLLEKFLRSMKPGRDFVLGWWTGEREGVGVTTKHGLSTIPADFFENMTVYAAVNKPISKPAVPKRPKLENKVYATVYISDGDNIQYCQHAMAKIFRQGARGQMPMNWTISPALVDIAPQIMNYYYKQATVNDCFACGPSGLGYAMPYDSSFKQWNTLTYNAFLPYTRLSQRYLEKAGLRVVTIWDEVNANQRRAYADECRYLYGMTIQDWEHQDGRLKAFIQDKRLPFIPNYACYANGVDVITEYFNRDIRNFQGKEPMFVSAQITVWDGGPDELVKLKTTLEPLSPGNIHIVRADHFFNMYCEANHIPFDLTMTEAMEVTSSPCKGKAGMAADGSTAQSLTWTSTTKDGQGWIQCDFGEPYLLSRYVVRHAETSGLERRLNTRDFSVEASADGLAWTTIGTYSGNTEAVNDVDIEPMEARYVRLNITDAGADHVARIADIEVYGSH